MGKFDHVLLVSDFDDTLTNSAGWVSEGNIEALKYFTENGGTFTVNTGRAIPAFRNRLPDVPVNAPVILSNGALIYDYGKEELLYESLMPDTVRDDCIRLAEDNPFIGFEAYNGDDIYVHNPNLATHGHLTKVRLGYTQCPIENMPLPWTKVILEQTHENLLIVERYIRDRLADRYEAVFSNPYLLEMTAKGCNKGSTMLRLADMMGFSPEHIYASGDNMNDLAMLKAAKVGFAPEGCDGHLGDYGARLVSSKDSDPIKDVVAYLDGIYR